MRYLEPLVVPRMVHSNRNPAYLRGGIPITERHALACWADKNDPLMGADDVITAEWWDINPWLQ